MTFSSLWGWLLGRDRAEQIDALNLSDHEIALQSLIYQLANKLEDALLLSVGFDPTTVDGKVNIDDVDPWFAKGAWELITKAREDIKE